ncbi:MAG: hypothetical protein IPI04_18850 [Ignavibacteria bacterium]|nr:hypothetical protein [Ignavibacteria bacterium]
MPFWENDFQITEVKKRIEKAVKNIVYVATNYRHNPQFSFTSTDLISDGQIISMSCYSWILRTELKM